MARSQINLQDSFLNQVRKDNVPVTVTLNNGSELQGNVAGFDNFTIIVATDGGRQSLVYKHAVAIVDPSRPVDLTEPD